MIDGAYVVFFLKKKCLWGLQASQGLGLGTCSSRGLGLPVGDLSFGAAVHSRYFGPNEGYVFWGSGPAQISKM